MDVALPDVAVARKNGQDDVAVGSLIEGALLRAPVLTHLRDFQWQGVRRALELKGRCLFADEMGCGKTPQEGNNVNVSNSDEIKCTRMILHGMVFDVVLFLEGIGGPGGVQRLASFGGLPRMLAADVGRGNREVAARSFAATAHPHHLQLERHAGSGVKQRAVCVYRVLHHGPPPLPKSEKALLESSGGGRVAQFAEQRV